MAANTPAIYSDFATSFLEHPVLNDLSVVKNENAVKQAVRNLILTDFYERPFEPTKGCGIRGLLFEPCDDFTAGSIQTAITATIENWEKQRVDLQSVSVKANPDENSYSCIITVMLKNATQPIAVPVLLFRVR